MLIWNIISFFLYSKEELVVNALVFGVNLPLSNIPYLFFALLLNLIIHELGHALAISAEGQSIESVGISFYALYPSAFVSSFSTLTYKNICAGIWHNLILLLMCMLISYNSQYIHGVLFKPAESGVVVLSSYIEGIQPGNKIIAINDVPVVNHHVLGDVLAHIESHNNSICIGKSLFDTKDSSCCYDKDKSNGELCWKSNGNEMCILTSELFKQKIRHCKSSIDCNASEFCSKPLIEQGTILKIDTDIKTHYILSTGKVPVSISFLEPRYNWLPNYSLVVLDMSERFIFFVKIVAFGLAMLNVLPIRYLDGSHLVELSIKSFRPNQSNSARIISFILNIGTVVAIVSCGLSIANVVLTQWFP